MELTNPKLIAELLRPRQRYEGRAGSAGKPRMPKAKPHDRGYRPRHAMGSRCRCGECFACRENARWERIFQEKFADPTYYTRDFRLAHSSPLAEV
jgi:hypothetical protein